MSSTRYTIKDLRMDANVHPPAPAPASEEDEATFARTNAAAWLSMKLQLFGDIDVSNQAPVVFEINEKDIALPIKKSIIVGRRSTDKTAQPDFDLGVFEAEKAKSISRCHIRIERRDTMIFLTDLSSRNGTWLNGQKLIPNAPRLLRYGDELHIGDLKIKVKFPPIK